MHTNFTLHSMADMDDDAQAESSWSRSAGLLSQAGNADSVLKTLVSDKAADDWRVMARGFGMSSSEFLRIVIYERLYTVDGVASMTREQIARVSGKVPERVPGAGRSTDRASDREAA